MIECMLFDSDGTLVDSELLSFQIMAGMLEERAVHVDADELHLRCRGWKMTETLRVLGDENGVELGNGFLDEFRVRQAKEFDTGLYPIPGVTEVLPQLDFPMAVVTSGPLVKVRKALSVTALDGYFNGNIYSSYEVGIWKPDPEIYRFAARDMGYDIKNCLIIEDSPIGLEAAANSGAEVVFLNRYGDPVEYDNVREITSMLELPGLVNKL